LKLPPLYAIVNTDSLGHGDPVGFARELAAGGATVIQLRDKSAGAMATLSRARELRRVLPDATLIMNDRADLALAAGFDGVHVGQDDLSPAACRRVVGNARLVGFSTHSLQQVREADALPIDYIAVGPVFATATKANPDPVIGLAGVRAARAATKKPLVAIGGITRENARSLLDAGADSVAVIGDLLASPRQSAAHFLRVLG
jgi:thiamine-phosphate pyrophosphorylase